jgi:hypothetical protein
MSDVQSNGNTASETHPTRLRDALRKARTGRRSHQRVVELRDAKSRGRDSGTRRSRSAVAQPRKGMGLSDRGVAGARAEAMVDCMAHVLMDATASIVFVQEPPLGACAHKVP